MHNLIMGIILLLCGVSVAHAKKVDNYYCKIAESAITTEDRGNWVIITHIIGDMAKVRLTMGFGDHRMRVIDNSDYELVLEHKKYTIFVDKINLSGTLIVNPSGALFDLDCKENVQIGR